MENNLTVREIVEKYLEENKYDGLCNCDSECGCCLDDLMPCEEGINECQAGYKIMVTEKNQEDFYDAEVGDWVIVLKKDN